MKASVTDFYRGWTYNHASIEKPLFLLCFTLDEASPRTLSLRRVIIWNEPMGAMGLNLFGRRTIPKMKTPKSSPVSRRTSP